jgi:hypothetical protein
VKNKTVAVCCLRFNVLEHIVEHHFGQAAGKQARGENNNSSKGLCVLFFRLFRLFFGCDYNVVSTFCIGFAYIKQLFFSFDDDFTAETGITLI